MEDPNRPGPSSRGSAPATKATLQPPQQQQQQHSVLDVFGSDAHIAGVILVLLLLGLMRAAMTPCECL